jgi:hypothetical protein
MAKMPQQIRSSPARDADQNPINHGTRSKLTNCSASQKGRAKESRRPVDQMLEVMRLILDISVILREFKTLPMDEHQDSLFSQNMVTFRKQGDNQETYLPEAMTVYFFFTVEQIQRFNGFTLA